ncbi:Alg9-like mannosyltransferase family-domain-containing protein, partial [Blyttiomyces helicus]
LTWDLLTLLAILYSLHLAPFTKVEESFNLQATHDLIFLGPFPDALPGYDHISFPGVVPRTFVGPVVLWLLSLPAKFVLPATATRLAWQYVTRGILGTLVALSLGLLRRAVGREFGRTAAAWCGALNIAQFHLVFWGSRTLPNVFALVLVNMDEKLFRPMLPARVTITRTAMTMIGVLAFTATAFRIEIAILSAFIVLSDIAIGRYRVEAAAVTVITSFLVSLSVAMSVDSYFWDKPFIWTELEVLRFNTIQGGSAAYGVSPIYAYFTTLLPRIAPLALPLAVYGAVIDVRLRRYLVPAMAFVAVYSLLPHKEWRFVVYVVPLLNAAAGVAISALHTLTHTPPTPDAKPAPKRTTERLALIGARLLLPLTLAASLFTLHVSIHNYPGGEALARVHALVDHHQPPPAYVHIDVAAAMTGASRFGEIGIPNGWRYDKNETVGKGAAGAREFLDAGYTHLITATPAVHAGQWTIVDTVRGYDGI